MIIVMLFESCKGITISYSKKCNFYFLSVICFKCIIYGFIQTYEYLKHS